MIEKACDLRPGSKKKRRRWRVEQPLSRPTGIRGVIKTARRSSGEDWINERDGGEERKDLCRRSTLSCSLSRLITDYDTTLACGAAAWLGIAAEIAPASLLLPSFAPSRAGQPRYTRSAPRLKNTHPTKCQGRIQMI